MEWIKEVNFSMEWKVFGTECEWNGRKWLLQKSMEYGLIVFLFTPYHAMLIWVPLLIEYICYDDIIHLV